MTLRARRLLRLAAAASLAVSLSGCISLLPKSKPSQLYRFGLASSAAAPSNEAAAPSAPAAAPIGVYRVNGFFQREAAGDRILTLTGSKAAYIAEARWVAPAEVLFDEAVAVAFHAAPGRVRLVSRGEPVHADRALRLEVQNFETRYDSGRAPTVLVRVRAVLVRDQARQDVAEQVFEARAPAGENRIAAIVAAYDEALEKVLGELVAWTNSQAA